MTVAGLVATQVVGSAFMLSHQVGQLHLLPSSSYHSGSSGVSLRAGFSSRSGRFSASLVVS